jgi:hypothetical protein
VVGDFVPGGMQTLAQILFESKPAVVGAQRNSH